MITAKELEISFRKELNDLLLKYNAEISLQLSGDRWGGQDKMEVYIASDGSTKEAADFTLGRHIYGE